MSSNATPVSIRPAPDPDSSVDPAAVQAAIDYIRPALQADGGDLDLVGVSPDGEVQVRFVGACVGCPISAMTLRAGVERVLRSRVPGITVVTPVD